MVLASVSFRVFSHTDVPKFPICAFFKFVSSTFDEINTQTTYVVSSHLKSRKHAKTFTPALTLGGAICTIIVQGQLCTNSEQNANIIVKWCILYTLRPPEATKAKSSAMKSHLSHLLVRVPSA